jgi:transcriptional regulator with XRE-family HTH domain
MIIPVFDELKTSLRQSKLPIPYVVYRSGVGRETIAKWMRGDVYTPRIDTMLRVAAVLGQHIELTDAVKKMVNYYPKPTIKPPPITKPAWRGMSRHDLRVTMLKTQ